MKGGAPQLRSVSSVMGSLRQRVRRDESHDVQVSEEDSDSAVWLGVEVQF
jgi:hypothetical protein